MACFYGLEEMVLFAVSDLENRDVLVESKDSQCSHLNSPDCL